MKIYVTKWALTRGVIQYDEANRYKESEIMIVRNNGYTMHFHGEGRDWHKTEEAALQKVADMKRRKIASLKKQIAKLEKV